MNSESPIDLGRSAWVGWALCVGVHDDELLVPFRFVEDRFEVVGSPGKPDWVSCRLIGGDSVPIDPVATWFVSVLNEISRSLTLAVYSADIFVNWSTHTYLCIDVNPASAFFNSTSARREFVQHIFI